jgi:hypothetical protein
VCEGERWKIVLNRVQEVGMERAKIFIDTAEAKKLSLFHLTPEEGKIKVRTYVRADWWHAQKEERGKLLPTELRIFFINWYSWSSWHFVIKSSVL